MSWYGAKAYCEWVGRRLPTEPEWEKVAHWNFANAQSYMYPWGNNFNCSKANIGGACDGTGTSPIGSFPSGVSYYGAYDMAGNVREWTADWYPGNKEKVIRGGSWYNYIDLSRSSFRYMDEPTATYQNIGFRCVQSP